MKKKKVLIIQRQLPFYRIPLFEKLLNFKDIEFYLITGENDSVSGGSNKIDSSKYIRVKNKKLKIRNFEIWRQPEVVNKIKKINPDVVIIEGMISNIANWDIIRLKKKMSFKLVAWVCGYQKHRSKFKDLLLRKFFKACDSFLAYHSAAKDFLIDYGIEKNDITILYNSIEVKGKSNKNDVEKIRKKYSLGNKRVILYVGRILESKKIEILLDSVKTLGDEYVCIVVGGGNYLDRLKGKYTANKNIHFTGEVIKGKEKYFKASGIFVLPGPGGLSLNEALYHGLPIISSLADGSAGDLVINGYNGFLIENMNSNRLASKIKFIFENKKMALYSKNSLKLGKKFSFDGFVKNYISGVNNSIEGEG